MPIDELGDGSVLRFPAGEFHAFHQKAKDEERLQYDRDTGDLLFEVGEEIYEADSVAVRNNQAGGRDEVMLRRRLAKA